MRFCLLQTNSLEGTGPAGAAVSVFLRGRGATRVSRWARPSRWHHGSPTSRTRGKRARGAPVGWRPDVGVGNQPALPLPCSRDKRRGPVTPTSARCSRAVAAGAATAGLSARARGTAAPTIGRPVSWCFGVARSRRKPGRRGVSAEGRPPAARSWRCLATRRLPACGGTPGRPRFCLETASPPAAVETFVPHDGLRAISIIAEVNHPHLRLILDGAQSGGSSAKTQQQSLGRD